VGILNLASRQLLFNGMVGTGGIGHGSFFLLEGNETLGREESRAGRFLDRRDYCKLHIISHYLRVLMGPAFSVFPVGRVGDDDAGTRLLQEMRAAGLDLRFVERVPGSPTLYSFCFLYPDGSGGNLTTASSACAAVDPAAVEAASAVMAGLGTAGIALAVPEVPLAARRALLALATRHGLFRVASFTRAEIRDARASGLLGTVDLLAVNMEEAAASVEVAPGGHEPAELAARVTDALCREHPRLLLSMTAGAAGSWVGSAGSLSYEPALPVEAKGTAGAGDAHLAGLLAGLSAGLDLPAALPLATLVAAASVTSAHTIDPDIARSLRAIAARGRPGGASAAMALLDNPNGQP
jgi:ribokinase